MSPPSFTLSLRALLTLPYRLCNPPPSAGNVRSCKVTPLIKVSLDDVLNKRHLPPLTLKDFEEWLVFVEGCPQYLYFLLWFKEYESRYAAWLAKSGCELPVAPSPPKYASMTTLSSAPSANGPNVSDSYVNLIPPSAALALFFTRAKQTFLDPAPQAPYALGPDALAALVIANTPSTQSFSPSIPKFIIPPLDEQEDSPLPPAIASHPHPHPRELAPLAQYSRQVLKERLDRFAAGACQNAGTRRAWCGVAGGSMMILLLGILPILITLFWAHSRWWRIVGWFGFWLGGTFVISSLHGICLMIYAFGDHRQLRSFELARPTISSPRAIARARPRFRSFFTRTPDGSAEDTDTNAGPTSRAPQLPLLQEGEEQVDCASTVASETSTGTPVVRLGPPAIRSSPVSDASTVNSFAPARTSSESDGKGQGQDGLGSILVSPPYYPEGTDPTFTDAGEKAQVAVQRFVESVKSGAGRVLTWVKGGAGASLDASYAGTFGVRSRMGRLDGDMGPGVTGAADDGEYGVEGGLATDAEVLTAVFIPHEYPDVGVVEKEMETVRAPVQFDFDGLPLVRPIAPILHFHSPPPAQPAPPTPTTQAHPTHAPAASCSPVRWDTCPRHPAVEASLASCPQCQCPTTSGSTSQINDPTVQSDTSCASASTSWRARFRRVTGVPVFGPLTRVFAPIVLRGQWEIVIHSAAVAAVGTWVVVGGLVALPERW